MNLLEMAAANRLEPTGATMKMSIPKQKSDQYKVYYVPLVHLYYNDQNGRINTTYKQYQAENGVLEPESGDSEYNRIFQEFIYKSGEQALKDTMASIEEKTQQQPAVVLSDGRVIDGNRRFTALRMIQEKLNIPQELEAIILPLDSEADRKTIKELELDLQLGREERVSYDPIDRIFDVYNTLQETKLMTIEEYKKASGARSTKGINRDLRLAELVLKFIGIVSPGGNPVDKFYLARDLKIDGPIEEVEGTLTKLKDSEKEAITEAVLVQIAVAKTDKSSNDATRVMRDLKTNVLRNPEVLKYYLAAVDEKVDDIIDAFEDSPISSANDLKRTVMSDINLQESVKSFQQSTNRLIQKGKNDSKRKLALSQLEDIRDNLEELEVTDFEALNTDEYLEAKSVLREITDITFKLKKDLK